MHGQRTWLKGGAYASITEWFALNSNELAWIALAGFGVLAAGLML